MDKIINFRDLGGYKTKDGYKIKNGMIFRSGELSDLSSKDEKKLLKDIKLKTIVDFRDKLEIEKSPDKKFDNINYYNIDIMGEEYKKSPSLEGFSQAKDNPHDIMKNIYKTMILSEYSQNSYKKFFDLLKNTKNAPLVFHCFAGKDRTGLAAVYILNILDVDKDTIYKDYLKTNEFRRKANNSILDDLKNKGISKAKLKYIEDMLYVDKSYLDIAYETIDKYFGDINNYIKSVLKISSSDKDAFKDMYLDFN